MKPEEQQLLKEFYQTLTDRPLEPEDKCYVPYLQKCGGEDPIADLATRIRWRESETVNLLTGQRGSGKSTELRRLRQMLRNDECTVFLCDMKDYMNLTTPVEITDFLIAIMGALSEAVAAQFDGSPAEKGYWERICGFLKSDITLTGFSIPASGSELAISIKDNPDFKQRLQESLRYRAEKLIEEAHGFSREVVEFVRKRTGDSNRKVVLMVDSFEQIRGVGVERSRGIQESVENLFSGHAASLQLPMLHVIYTVPPYISTLAPSLGRQFGDSIVQSLPSIHVRNKDQSQDMDGLEVMVEIVEQRFKEWHEVFSEAQIHRMALDTGGDLRNFFRFIGGSLIKANATRDGRLPVENTVIDKVEDHLRREMLPLADDDKKWLKKIAESKDTCLESTGNLADLARYFDCSLVLNYRNGEDWYDIHPLLRKEICGEAKA